MRHKEELNQNDMVKTWVMVIILAGITFFISLYLRYSPYSPVFIENTQEIFPIIEKSTD